jgi:hypothetical protein
MWVGLCSVEVLPSPKSHSQEVTTPLEVSVKDTVNGAHPAVGTEVLKLATGATVSTVMRPTLVQVSAPPSLLAVRLTV